MLLQSMKTMAVFCLTGAFIFSVGGCSSAKPYYRSEAKVHLTPVPGEYLVEVRVTRVRPKRPPKWEVMPRVNVYQGRKTEISVDRVNVDVLVSKEQSNTVATVGVKIQDEKKQNIIWASETTMELLEAAAAVKP